MRRVAVIVAMVLAFAIVGGVSRAEEPHVTAALAKTLNASNYALQAKKILLKHSAAANFPEHQH